MSIQVEKTKQQTQNNDVKSVYYIK